MDYILKASIEFIFKIFKNPCKEIKRCFQFNNSQFIIKDKETNKQKMYKIVLKLLSKALFFFLILLFG